MGKVVPLERQSVFDIALQTSGGVEAAFALALNNGLSISGDLMPDTELETVEVVNASVLARYTLNNIRPATVIEIAAVATGIGGMGIEIDFIVN